MSILKGKAVDIIRTFTKDEFKRFEAFVESPYFNSNKSIVRLIHELQKYHPEFNSDKMSEESLYGKVFGTGKFSYSALKNLMSELILVCDKFLVHDRVDRDINLKNGNSIQLLQEYRERKLDKLFDLRSRKFEEELKKHSIHNAESYVLSFHVEILKYQYHLYKHSHNKLIWNGFLKTASYELCNIFQMLYSTTDAILHSAELLVGKPAESIMIKFVKRLNLEEFIKDFNSKDSEENFFVDLYSRLILMMLNEQNDTGEDYYFQIKNSFTKKLNLFANEHKYDILKSLRSYAINGMNRRNESFVDELFEINNLLITKIDYSSARIKWYIGELFSEMVILSVHKKDYKYAESFIEKYKDKLNPEIKEFETGWSKALLSLEYGNIDNALTLLADLKPVNTFMKLTIKNLYLRAFYELGYFDEAFSMLDAYKHFINKEKKFSDSKQKLYNLFHRLFSKLFKIKSEPGKFSGYDIKKLREDTYKFHFLANKTWFLDKINELEKLVR